MADSDEDNQPERPPGCVDAFITARDEARLLFKEIGERLGCAMEDDDVDDGDGDWSIKDAMDPAQDEASVILEEMGSWIEEYQPAIDQAKASLHASGKAIGAGAAKVVQPITAGMSAAMEPATEEARLIIREFITPDSKS